MQTENNRQKQKPKYGIFSNIRYMVRHALEVPGVLWTLGIQVTADVITSVVTLYMAPAFLSRLERHASLKE